MRFDGVQTTGSKFDYSGGVIIRKDKDEEDEPIRKSTNPLANLANQLGNFLAQGIMNPTASDATNSSSSAFNQ